MTKDTEVNESPTLPECRNANPRWKLQHKISRLPDIVTASVLACGTLLIYDYVILLDQEVNFVWNQPLTLGAVLFLFNRYLPFIDTFLSLHLLLGHDTAQGCTTKFTVVTWFISLGLINSELILMFRTYAIWSRERYILITLLITLVLCFIPALVVVELEIKSLKYVPNKLNVCALASASTIIIFGYILLTLSETVIAILTAIKAYRHFRHHSTSDWIAQMYREGLLFYVYLFSVSLANVLVPILAPPQFDNWLATPQRVIHSVLSTRVLLLIFNQKPSASQSTLNHSAVLPEFVNPDRSGATATTATEEMTGHIDMLGIGAAGSINSDIEMEHR